MPGADHRLILASTSAYRRRLLERLGVPFDCIAPEVAEDPLPRESAQALAVRLAQAKALAVSRQYPTRPVLGSDQTAVVGDRLLSKPGTPAVAREQLRACSGAQVAFHTAVALCIAGEVRDEHRCATQVHFRDLSAPEIRAYVERDQPLDCAGSFRWEGLGICLFRALRSDDPTALEGLPLIGVADMLRKIGINPLNFN